MAFNDLPRLSPPDLAGLTDWRHALHRQPELSGQEAQTARAVVTMLEAVAPDRILTGLGGHGVAAVFEGGSPGPAVLLRCELDGLPITEVNAGLPYLSEVPGKGHLCGHDGHMAILAGCARMLGRHRPARGRVVLLFQPAEEDGAGAARVLADPRFDEIAPDYAFALHNFPGLPLGQAALQAGVMNCASRGMRVMLEGQTAHASLPETGRSPAPALAQLLTALPALGAGDTAEAPEFARVTVTHASLGARAFGVAPGEAELWATLRSRTDDHMAALVARAEAQVAEVARAAGLGHAIAHEDIFAHCENDPEATECFRAALEAEAIPIADAELPMRASEDFGRFRARSKSAMVLLGAGTDRPSLHNPDYDFPDALIAVGAGLFLRVVAGLCGLKT